MASPRQISVELPTVASDEPVLSIPQPAGWALTTEENCERVRGVLCNAALNTGGFITNVFVTLRDDSDTAKTAAQALEAEQAALLPSMGALEGAVEGEICGFPSRRYTYQIEGRHGVTQIVAVADNGTVWLAAVNAQTAKPACVGDIETILDGFTVSLPKEKRPPLDVSAQHGLPASAGAPVSTPTPRDDNHFSVAHPSAPHTVAPEFLALPRAADDEPALRLLIPCGWVAMPGHTPPPIRAALANPALTQDEFTPTVVVTLAEIDGALTPDDAVAAVCTDLQRHVGQFTADTPGTCCGFPSRTVSFGEHGREVTQLIVAAPSTDRVWVSTLTMQTTQPAQPEYLRGKRAILEGFQFR